MRLIQTRLGRVTAGAILPLAVVAALVSAASAQAVVQSRAKAASPTGVVAPSVVRAVVPAAEPLYTLAQVSKHSTQTDCWTVINGGVYNLNTSNFINNHEGGTAVLLTLCGLDGSGMFNKQHAGQSDPASRLAGLRIGAFDSTPPPVPATTFTIAQVATHNSQADCYTVVSGVVYNLTSFISHHPGGTAPILGLCGLDGTASFTGKHSGSLSAQSTLALYSIGKLTGPSTVPAPTTVYTPTQLAAHNTTTDCWIAISGNVYDVTVWKATHTGTPAVIDPLCGTDATATFLGKHSATATTKLAILANFMKGTLNGTATPTTPSTVFTLTQLATHNNTATDCWVSVAGNVYDLTTWKKTHTGGEAIINGLCGTDGTVTFQGHHGAGAAQFAILAAYLKGTLAGYVPVPLPAPVTVDAVTFHGDFTMVDVKKHNSAADCWSVINGSIYGLSTWIPVHPGGSSVVAALCGTDGTASYNGKHGSSASAGAILAKLRIGSLVGSTAKPQGQYTLVEVAAHKTPADCWSAINGNVYDLTQWIGQHPGGPAVIQAMCGTDGTAAYMGKHGTDAKAQVALDQFKVGTLLPAAASAPTPATLKAFTARQVRLHRTARNCWTVVSGNVYNMTPWTKAHKSHTAAIKAMCGHNATKTLNRSLGGSAKASAFLSRYLIGTFLAKSAVATPAAKPVAAPAAKPTAPAASGLYTVAQVGGHTTPADCWSIVSGNVYNLTTWIGQHPGGPAVIQAMCGKDGTASFQSMHSSSATAQAALAKLKIGIVG